VFIIVAAAVNANAPAANRREPHEMTLENARERACVRSAIRSSLDRLREADDRLAVDCVERALQS
jgi:hypothetical protein